MHPNGGPDSLHSIVDIMKFIRRLNLGRIYGGEIALMRQHFDTTLSRLFTQLFTDGVGPKAFWAIYSEITGLVVDCADCKALLEAKGDWLPFTPSTASRARPRSG